MPPRPESRPLPALIAAALLLGGCAEKPDQEDSSTETDATTATASDATATTAGSDATTTNAEDTEADCVTPAREAAVVIDNGVGELAGTMLIPEGCAPFPVVVIHAGSGPTDRNGNSPLLAGQNDSLKQLAEALQARGIATVRYDKRGVGESVGALQRDVTALRFEDYARDLELWIDAVSGDATFGEVTALGHSEGALIATVAAASTPPDRLISLAGAGRPAPEVLREQLTASLPEDLLAEALAILDQLEQGALVAEVPTELMSLFAPSVQPYLISWFAYDPAEALAGVAAPALIAAGTTDIQVPVSDAALLASARPDAALCVIEGMNHVLKPATLDPASQDQAYSDPSLQVVPALVDCVAAFVRDE